MKKIVVTGAQCSLKTTTISYVYSELKYEGLLDVRLEDKKATKCVYPINQASSFESQNWIILQQILAEMDWQRKNPDLLLLDRCVIDQLIYFDYLLHHVSITPNLISQREYLEAVINSWLKLCPYDAIFLLHPLPIKKDCIRPADAKFQDEIATLFDDYFMYNKIPCFFIDEPRETRRDYVLKEIKKVLKR